MPRKSSNLLKRRLKIAEIVAAQGEIKVDDLSAQLGVSGVTIRGDLSYLEQQGYLKRSFGGAIATPLSSEPEAIQPIAPLSLAQQMEIARHCARLIRDRDTLFLWPPLHRFGRTADLQLYLDGPAFQRAGVWQARPYADGLFGR